jgi:hypothetical protein
VRRRPPEVDRMVPCLHLANHPALQVGERLLEERRPRLSHRVWRAGEGTVRDLRSVPTVSRQDGILQTFTASFSEPNATEGATSDVRVSPACAVGYNAPQDGKYNVETGNGGAGARGRFRVAQRLRTDSLPEQAGRGASRPVRLRQLRLSRIGAGRARRRPQRPQQPGFRRQRNSL